MFPIFISSISLVSPFINTPLSVGLIASKAIPACNGHLICTKNNYHANYWKAKAQPFRLWQKFTQDVDLTPWK